MMDANFSQRIKDVLSYSKEEAVRLGNNQIGTEHLFLGILRDGEGLAVDVLLTLGTDLVDLKKTIEGSIRNNMADNISETENIPLLKQAERVLKLVYLEAKSLKQTTIDTGHLLLAILKDEDSIVTQSLNELDIDYKSVKTELEGNNPRATADFPGEEEEEENRGFGGSKGSSQQAASKTSSDTPVLDNFGTDLTKAAEENRLDPIIGREREIERLAQILSRRKKNNPILIGEPGVGKSAIAEGLAMRIIQRKVSRVLFGKRVVTLDLASIVAGTKYRGQLNPHLLVWLIINDRYQ